MRSTAIPFPAVKAIFDRVLSNLGRTEKSVADGLEKSGATVNNYLNGKRLIPASFLRDVVKELYPRDPKKRSDLEREVQAALEFRASGDLLEDIRSGTPLNITSIAHYGPISGKEQAFFEKFAKRFLMVMGIKAPIVERTSLRNLGFQTNGLHMTLFDSPDRMLHLRFFRFPLRMALGAVADANCLAHAKVDRKLVEQVMSNPDSANLIPRGVKPVVIEGEVGASHCRKRLGFTELSEVNSGLDLDQIITQFRKDLAEYHNGGPIPVFCSDEFTAIRLAGRLKQLGQRPIRVFPLASRRAAQTNPASRDLPQYHASIAIKRTDETKSFYFFLLDALSQFLSTEVETMANWWAEMATELTNTVVQNITDDDSKDYAMRWAAAWEWVQYVMHLDKESIASYDDPVHLPWRPILLRARKIVNSGFAKDSELIKHQIDCASKAIGNNPPPPLKTVISTLEGLFEVKFKGNYEGDDVDAKKRGDLIKDLTDRLKEPDTLPLIWP